MLPGGTTREPLGAAVGVRLRMERIAGLGRSKQRDPIQRIIGPHTGSRLCLAGLLAALLLPRLASSQQLPDSPGTLLTGETLEGTGQVPSGTRSPTPAGQQRNAVAAPATGSRLPLCDTPAHTSSPEANAAEQSMAQTQPPCRVENPIQPIVTSRQVKPLSVKDKGELAIRDVTDPFNLATIAAYSGIAVADNPHSPYGPGLKGWGRLSGYSLVEDAQGEFFGTFVISSLAHEDPRYHRMPNASVKRRVLHAVAHTWVSQHDDGTSMPNYSTLLTYPISAELSNLYVPGVPTNLPSTVKRVGIGLATDPSGTVVAEFLPDLAKHIHVHVIFIQEILNQVVTGGTAPNVQ